MAKRSGDTLQLDGFDFTKSRRFPKLVPQIRSRSFKYADPEILSQLNDNPTIKFTISSSPTSMIRLAKRPFHLVYIIQKKNPNYDAAAAVGTLNSKEWIPIQSSTPATRKDDNYYLNSALGGASFFSSASIRIGDNVIGENLNELGDCGFHYQAMDIFHSTEEDRKSYFGQDSIIETKTDRTFVANKITPKCYENLKSTDFISPNDPTACYSVFGMHGLFACGPRNFALQKLSGKTQNPDTPFFGPSTDVSICFNRVHPAYSLIEWPYGTTQYISGDDADKDTTLEGLKVKFISFKIQYELIEIHNNNFLDSWKRSPAYYFHEVIKKGVHNIISGTGHNSIKLLLPPKTKLVYFALVNREMLMKTSGRPLVARYTFPSNLKKIRVFFPGEDDLLCSGGLENVASRDGYISPSCQQYYNYIHDKGIISCPYESLFPRVPEQLESYRQCLLVDLTTRNTNNWEYIYYEFDWTEANSPNDYYLLSFSVQEALTTAFNGVYTTEIV